MTPERFATVRFSTADLPEKDRMAIWREQVCRMGVKVDIEPINGVPFECSVVARALPGAHLMSVAISPVRVTRTPDFQAAAGADLIFLINQSGAVTAQTRTRDVSLRDGDALLASMNDVKVFDRHVHGSSLVFRLSRSFLSSLVPDVSAALMRRIPRDTEVLRLLAGYAAPLFNDIALANPEFRRTAVNHLHDLVALALAATSEPSAVVNGRALPMARLRMAKTYIIEHSHRRDLSVGTVAANIGLTPRNLQRLFESEGTTFSEFLLAQRLSRAHRMLTEPRLAQSAVGAIAYDAGFGDLSYFNRSFKRRYGATPRDIRNIGGDLEANVA